MMQGDSLYVVLHGEPIRQQRHRMVRRGKFVSSYDPCAKMKEQMREQIYNTVPLAQIERLRCAESLIVDIDWYFHIPASWSRPKRNLALWVGQHNRTPDRDNLDKFILDCGKGILWEDDCRVIGGRIRKHYGQEARTILKITEVKMDLDKETLDILGQISPKEFGEASALMEEFRNTGYLEGDTTQAAHVAKVIARLSSLIGKRLAGIAKKYPNHGVT